MSFLLLKKPADIQGKSWPAIVIGLFVAFGGVLFGYDVTVHDFLGPTDCTTSVTDMTPEQSAAFLLCHTGKHCSRRAIEIVKDS